MFPIFNATLPAEGTGPVRALRRCTLSAIQFDLFGDPIEEKKPQLPDIASLDFKGHGVRIVMVKGDPWFVASDVCRVLEIANSRDALTRLDDDEKGVATTDTLGGKQELAIVSESGLYSLILTSRKAEAKQFKRWIVHEVLPAIRKTGGYSLHDPIAKEAKRLKSDRRTAVARMRVRDRNKSWHSLKAANGDSPRDFADAHNAAYEGFTGMKAAELRKALGLKKGRTPLDRMSALRLAQEEHAIELGCRLEMEKGLGREEKLETIRSCSRDIARNDLKYFGTGACYGIVDDPKRGKIIDLITPQIA